MVERQATQNPANKIVVDDLDLWYGTRQVLYGVSLGIAARRVTALIGPSACGKSTFLRCLNRMNEVCDDTRLEGTVRIDGQDIYQPDADLAALRRRVGMVFQQSNPFPKSVFENVAYGPRVHGVRQRHELSAIVEQTLRQVALWDEVKDRLSRSAFELSGGQQQRLCIARALAVAPEVLLMDEPASNLDPRSTARIEDLIGELRNDYTIVIVTHNMQQASRVSDYTAFFYGGRLVESGATNQIFSMPSETQTEEYITGRIG